MRLQTPENAIKSLPREILVLLGPPPLLSTEDPKIYYAVLAYFVDDINPRDMVAWFLVKDLADYRIELLRLRRIKAENMQKASKDLVSKMERDINTSDKERRDGCSIRYSKAVKALEKEFADNPEELEARKAKRNDEYKAGIKDAERIHQQQQSDLKTLSESGSAVALTLHSWVADVLTLDQLLELAEKRFYNTLRALEHHLGGFGETIRERGAKILDGEVVTESSAAPANGSGNSSGKRNSQHNNNGNGNNNGTGRLGRASG